MVALIKIHQGLGIHAALHEHLPAHEINESLLGPGLHDGVDLVHRLLGAPVGIVGDDEPQTGLKIIGLQADKPLVVRTRIAEIALLAVDVRPEEQGFRVVGDVLQDDVVVGQRLVVRSEPLIECRPTQTHLHVVGRLLQHPVAGLDEHLGIGGHTGGIDRCLGQYGRHEGRPYQHIQKD